MLKSLMTKAKKYVLKVGPTTSIFNQKEYFSTWKNFFEFISLSLQLVKSDFQGQIWIAEIMRILKLSKILKFGKWVAEIIAILLRPSSFSDTL